MSSDVKEKLKSGMENFEYFSVALDESSDIYDTDQLAAIFVRGINRKYEIIEELVQLEPLKGMTTGRDVLNGSLRAAAEMNLNLSELITVMPDGAPAMVGSINGFVCLLACHLRIH